MKIQKRTLYPEAQIKPVSSPDGGHLPHHQRQLQAAEYEKVSIMMDTFRESVAGLGRPAL